MKNLIMLIIIVCAIFSCSKDKEIEIEIPKQTPKLVVYSTLTQLDYTKVKTLEIDIKSSLHIFDNSESKITDAEVLYYENDILKDTLVYSSYWGSYMLTNQTIDDIPKVGNTYSVKIKKEGFETVTAKTTIPPKVNIIDTNITSIAYIDEEGVAVSEINLTFNDPEDQINYYEIAVSDIAFSYDSLDGYYDVLTYESIITSESYYPSLISFDVDKPNFLLFNDKTINGNECNLKIYYTPPQYLSENRYIRKHYVSLQLRNVTEEYYKYKTTMLLHLYNNNEDVLYGMGEPINVLSNINNGYGLFAGFNNEIVSFLIPEQVVN